MKIASIFSILILFFNLAMIVRFGTDVPFWDQWGSEAALYIAWEEQQLAPSDLIKPHVQHRFAVSKVLRLMLFEVLGGWSPLANMILQSFLVPIIFLVFFSFFKDRLERSPPKRWLFYAISAAVFLLPFYWEVILLGFQSHFYLSLIFALLLISMAAREPSWSTLCWFFIIGVTNVFTSASSLVPLLAAFSVQLASLAAGRKKRTPAAWSMLLSTLFLIVLTANLLVFPANHQQYGANSLTNFLWLSLQAFSWPVEYLGIICLWIIPLALSAYGHKAWTVRGARQLGFCIVKNRSNLALFGLLLWLILSIGTIAYARGNFALFASRYLNIYAFTLYVPFIVYLLFIKDVLQLRPPRYVVLTGVIVYCLLVVGLFREALQELERCRRYKHDMDIVRENLIEALRQNDPLYLYEQQKINFIYGAYPDPGRAFAMLNHPALREKHLWLPLELRNAPAQDNP
jgi:hypothetical protein